MTGRAQATRQKCGGLWLAPQQWFPSNLICKDESLRVRFAGLLFELASGGGRDSSPEKLNSFAEQQHLGSFPRTDYASWHGPRCTLSADEILIRILTARVLDSQFVSVVFRWGHVERFLWLCDCERAMANGQDDPLPLMARRQLTSADVSYGGGRIGISRV